MIRIDQIWLATEPLDMRAGPDTALARIVQVFGSAKPHCACVGFVRTDCTGVSHVVVRRPRRTGQTRPTTRRVFTELRKASPLALVAMAVGLGLLEPVMGVSLLVFLLVDAILSLTSPARKSTS